MYKWLWSFLEENVTCVCMDKDMFMYDWIIATSHLYGRFEILKKKIYFDINGHFDNIL